MNDYDTAGEDALERDAARRMEAVNEAACDATDPDTEEDAR